MSCLSRASGPLQQLEDRLLLSAAPVPIITQVEPQLSQAIVLPLSVAEADPAHDPTAPTSIIASATASRIESLAPATTAAAAIPKQRVERSDNYINLGLNNKWVYRIGRRRVVERVTSVTPNADGEAIYVLESPDGRESYSVDPTGVYLHKIVSDGGGFNNNVIRFVDPLKFLPATLEAGTSHKVGGQVRVNVPSLTSRALTGNFTGQVAVRRFETITVPAGTFKAVRVEMILNLSVSARISGRKAVIRIVLTGTTWLAEGVGTIKWKTGIVVSAIHGGTDLGRESTSKGARLIRHTAIRGGLTILTHDSNADSNGWPASMASAIAARVDQITPGTVVYRLGFDNQANVLTGLVKVSGPVEGSKTHNGQVVVMLDWSGPDPAQAGTNIRDLASSVAAYLNTEHPEWMDKYVHMIGHGRGATFNSLLARRLRNVAVTDHFTSLDPLKVRRAFDPNIRIGSWIDFADNYYRQDGAGTPDPFDIDGVSVAGAFNVMLNESRLENGGHDAEHDDVPLWYLGTITGKNTSDGEQVPGRGWYNRRLGMGPRTKVGFNIVQHTVYL